MDGDFSVKRILKWLFLAALAFALTCTAGLLRDRQVLRNELVRLHVVANSNSPEDQAAKLAVRDAVLALVEDTMVKLPAAQDAAAYLTSRSEDIQAAAEAALSKAGLTHTVTVTLEEEAFPTRDYDTFRLPAGVYNTLRLTIGEGTGKNWWCVLFPSLCIPASSDGFEEAAEAAGMSGTLSHTLTEQNTGFQIRFRFLEWLGELENKLFSGLQ